MVGLLDLGARGQSDVTSAERKGCLVIYDLVASFKAEKRKVIVGDVWFRVSSLSLSQSWSSSLWISFAFFWSDSSVEKFVFYSVFVFLLEQIGFSLFFTAKATNCPKNFN